MVERPPAPDPTHEPGDELDTVLVRAAHAMGAARLALLAARRRLVAPVSTPGELPVSPAIDALLLEDGGWWTAAEIVDQLQREGRCRTRVNMMVVCSELLALLARGRVERRRAEASDRTPPGTSWLWRTAHAGEEGAA